MDANNQDRSANIGNDSKKIDVPIIRDKSEKFQGGMVSSSPPPKPIKGESEKPKKSDQ